jgi:hypothetical protein
MPKWQANEIRLRGFHLRGNRAGFLKRYGVSGRKPDRERFPRRPGKLGLWGKAKSAAQVAGFVERQEGSGPLDTLPRG